MNAVINYTIKKVPVFWNLESEHNLIFQHYITQIKLTMYLYLSLKAMRYGDERKSTLCWLLHNKDRTIGIMHAVIAHTTNKSSVSLDSD